MELKVKIISKAAELFLVMGYKGLTMDYICELLGISKRTLYEQFQDKNHLIREALIHVFLSNNKEMVAITEKHANIFDAIIEIMNFQFNKSSSLAPFVIDDIKKYSRVLEVNNALISNLTKDRWIPFAIIDKGIEQEVFKGDLDVKLVHWFLQEIIIMIHDLQRFDITHYNFQDINKHILLPYFRGLCTAKGLQMMDERMEKMTKSIGHC